MLADPSWAFRQYDHQLFRNTVVAPGADAAVLRLSAPGVRAPSGAADRAMRFPPTAIRAGAVSNRVRGLAWWWRSPPSTSPVQVRDRVALVNCLNFGNPEHPAVMWQLSEAIDGIAEACGALGIPVVGGNVSLYNESNGNRYRPDAGGRHARIDRQARSGGPHPLVQRRGPGAPVGRHLSHRVRAGQPSAVATRAVSSRRSTWRCIRACSP